MASQHAFDVMYAHRNVSRSISWHTHDCAGQPWSFHLLSEHCPEGNCLVVCDSMYQ